jgi:hypothetical protein
MSTDNVIRPRGEPGALSVDQRIASAISNLRAAWGDVLQASGAPDFERDDEGRFEEAYRQIENAQANLEEWECRQGVQS